MRAATGRVIARGRAQVTFECKCELGDGFRQLSIRGQSELAPERGRASRAELNRDETELTLADALPAPSQALAWCC